MPKFIFNLQFKKKDISIHCYTLGLTSPCFRKVERLQPMTDIEQMHQRKIYCLIKSSKQWK